MHGRRPGLVFAILGVLFGVLIMVVLGSMTGEWLSIKQMLPGEAWYWFGHRGYEYLEPGRVWQIGLLIGLVLWLFLVARALVPALRRDEEPRPVLTPSLIGSIAIAGLERRKLPIGTPAPVTH